MMIVFF